MPSRKTRKTFLPKLMLKSRSKLLQSAKFRKTSLTLVGLLVAVAGIYWVLAARGAREVTLDTFPVVTDKYSLEQYWPGKHNGLNYDECRSYLQYYNCHHDYDASDIFDPLVKNASSYGAAGSWVRAAKGGTVNKVDDNFCNGARTGNGARIYIDGSDGFRYMYLHLQPGTLRVSNGQRIAAGTYLGKIGKTECAQSKWPHLHFEVRRSPYGSADRVNIQPSVTDVFWSRLSSWHKVPGVPSGASDIGIGANGTLWATSLNGQEYRWTGSGWSDPPGGGSAIRISADQNGRPWKIVSDSLNIYCHNGSSWVWTGGKGRDIGIGSNGAVWAMGTNGRAAKWQNGSTCSSRNYWGGGFEGNGLNIDVDPSGRAWKSNYDGSFYYFNGEGFSRVSGTVNDVGIGKTGPIWVIGNTRTGGGWRIFYRNGSSWSMIPNGGATRIDVASNGRPWVVNDSGAVYHYWRTYPSG